jgi:hypothetical protein
MSIKLAEEEPKVMKDISLLDQVDSRFALAQDGTYPMILTGSIHKIQALLLVKPVPTPLEIKAAMPAVVTQWNQQGLDHLVYKKAIEKVITTTTQSFVRKHLLPYTLYVAQP